MRHQVAIYPDDGVIARLAEGQHGVVAWSQLLSAGFSASGVPRKVRAGRLHPIHRGVYAVGHRRLTREGRWLAAVLAAGPKAALSHRTAGALWAIHDSDRIDVTVPRSRRNLARVTLHHSKLGPDERTTERGIPVTTVPRTLLDLAAVLPRHRLERALNEAEYHHRHTDPLSLHTLVARHPRRRGVAVLKAVLHTLGPEPALTRSELEDRFLALLDAASLPRPEVNAPVAAGDRRFECDFVWRSHRLVVELDGRAAHMTTAAFERDRARDRSLHAAGWRAFRITWRQMHDDHRAVLADLRKTLGAY